MTINTTLTLRKTNKKKPDQITRAIIEGAALYYVKLQKPAAVFEQRDMRNPTKTEWTTDLVVSEETADAYDEIFTKQSSTKLTKEKFMQKYRIEKDEDLPDPTAKKFFVIKVKHAAQDKDGNNIADDSALRPLVVQLVDDEAVDITHDVIVGNGSKGNVLLRVSQNDFGTFSYLSRVLVTDLVEYEGAGGTDETEDEFLGGATLKRKSKPNPAQEAVDGFAEDGDDDADSVVY